MDKALYDRGMAMRRKVLGDEYVDRAVANTDDFNRKFQDLLNEFCWGPVWTDEDLKPRDRSLLNLGMIACLGRMHEFEAHFRGALRNGLTPKELSAVLRQVAIYCGFPAAVDAHRVAKQVLAAEAKKFTPACSALRNLALARSLTTEPNRPRWILPQCTHRRPASGTRPRPASD